MHLLLLVSISIACAGLAHREQIQTHDQQRPVDIDQFKALATLLWMFHPAAGFTSCSNLWSLSSGNPRRTKIDGTSVEQRIGRYARSCGSVACGRLDDGNQQLTPDLDGRQVRVRYMYEGGRLGQGRICLLNPASQEVVTGREVLATLQEDDVDLSRFYACVYTAGDGNGWMRIHGNGDATRFRLPEVDEDGRFVKPPRIDVKLFVQSMLEYDGRKAEARAVPGSYEFRSFPEGYFGIGVVQAKDHHNVGQLWRSAYQLGASFIFTVGKRWKKSPADTVTARCRIPLHELTDWNNFVEFAPHGAEWVAVEMGGTPLDDFEHPKSALYLLGSEDAGMPKSVLDACHHRVSLRSARYGSYNVAVAGSIVMYDRNAKARKKQLEEACAEKALASSVGDDDELMNGNPGCLQPELEE